MENLSGKDERIAYGANCTWWGKIADVGKRHLRDAGTIPCCPHCNRMLFEVPNAEKWWATVDRHAAAKPGYREFVEWLEGRCFANILAALNAYTHETGNVLKL